MKVGILTFHFSDNYGAALQAYALQEKIKALGHHCEIINYKPSAMRDDQRHVLYCDTSSFALFIRSLLSCLYHLPCNIKAVMRWKKFRKTLLNISDISFCDENIMKIRGRYEVLIVGSDQVWNSKITGPGAKYFLQWADSERKIAYAASFGDIANTINLESENLRSLEKFYAISVRENYAKQYLLDQYGILSEVMPDPTIFLTEKSFEKEMKDIHADDYVLLYVVKAYDGLENFSKKIARMMNCKLIILNGRARLFDGSTKSGNDSGPLEFVSLIKKAKLVISSSFHGTMLSIIYGKAFLSVVDGEREGRIENLCASYGLENHMIKFSNMGEWNGLENAKLSPSLEKKLEEKRVSAEKWLMDCLK